MASPSHNTTFHGSGSIAGEVERLRTRRTGILLLSSRRVRSHTRAVSPIWLSEQDLNKGSTTMLRWEGESRESLTLGKEPQATRNAEVGINSLPGEEHRFAIPNRGHEFERGVKEKKREKMM